MEGKFKVSCFGAGFVGLPTTSVLALKNPNCDFVVFDIDEKKIKMCGEGKMPIFEPELEQTFAEVHKKNLTLSHKIEDALDNVSVIFLALPTPTKTVGEGTGRAYDLSYTEKAVANIAHYYNKHPEKMLEQVILVEKSTVPIGTAKMINKILMSISIPENRKKYIITSNPEFLAEGTAIKDLKTPDRVVVGVYAEQHYQKIQKLSALFSYVGDRVIYTNSASSELSKLTANCFLAQRVSSINSIALMCEQYDSDINEVRKCIASDTRIGDKFLNSSVGWGGSCFQKDILALIYLAELKGLTEVANYWNAVISMNNHRKKMFFRRVYKQLNNNLKGKKLAIFGTAFKKGTCDARESPAIDICKDLLVEGAILNLVDPKTSRDNFIWQMKYNGVYDEKFEPRLIEIKEASEAVKDAHAILILTEWDEFKSLPYKQFYNAMNKPAYIFDGRNILDQNEMKGIGYNFIRIGKKYVDREYHS